MLQKTVYTKKAKTILNAHFTNQHLAIAIAETAIAQSYFEIEHDMIL